MGVGGPIKGPHWGGRKSMRQHTYDTHKWPKIYYIHTHKSGPIYGTRDTIDHIHRRPYQIAGGKYLYFPQNCSALFCSTFMYCNSSLEKAVLKKVA